MFNVVFVLLVVIVVDNVLAVDVIIGCVVSAVAIVVGVNVVSCKVVLG